MTVAGFFSHRDIPVLYNVFLVDGENAHGVT